MNIKSKLSPCFKESREYAVFFVKWAIIAVITGIIGGAVGAAFSKSISLVTGLRSEHAWLLYLLPIGGALIALIYKLCRVEGMGTNEVFESVRTEKKVPILLTPAIFLGSVVTHLLGGSAGREGAALQLGGSISSFLGKIFKLSQKERHIIIMCGMASVFSAVFGTPVCAAVFAVEVVSVGYLFSSALFPCIVSSVSAYFVALRFGISPERFNVDVIPDFTAITLLKVLLIALAAAFVSILFCKTMHITASLFKKYLKNAYIRSLIGSIIIVLLTVILRTTDYNGGGIDVIERIFESGDVRYEAFILKIIFTAITIGAGFKGGEIVPTLFIGATLGGSIALIIGLNPGFGAAVGMAALFCGVTNCPLATFLLSIELFGSDSVLYYALAAAVSFLISGYTSLYSGQKIVFSKLSEDVININGK